VFYLKKILSIFVFVFVSLFAMADEQNTSIENLSLLALKDISSLEQEVEDINKKLNDNIWIKRYKNYLLYKTMQQQLYELNSKYDKYKNRKENKYQELTRQLKNKINIKKRELELVEQYKESPIGNKIKPKEISSLPKVTNPFSIVEAFSYKKQLQAQKNQYTQNKNYIKDIYKLIIQKNDLLQKMDSISDSKYYHDRLLASKEYQKDFELVLDIVSTTDNLYSKKINRVSLEVNELIVDETSRTLKILFVIIVLVGLSIGLRKLFKRYIDEDDRHYTINKIINFILVILIIFILLFSYIENASYLVTFLGFASAGIAIALKDWFMSIFGWMVIMTSGSINVGDRIKVTRSGLEVVGDVLDISMFKISIREDITLTSYMKNRRSGRVFFVPNNYVFTDLIANYTYDSMRTVWDSIDLYITFDSNYEKAVSLATQVAKKHSIGYTELAKKRLDKLRTKYVLRSANPEPRIFSFLEPYGIVISTWYMTNSYATLSLRSKVSMAILSEFLKADDISIAYPTQTLRVSDTKFGSEVMLPGVHSGFFDGG